MNEYIVKLVNSTRDLTARELIRAKDFTGANSIDAELQIADSFTVDLDFIASFSIVNEASKGNREYNKYVLGSKDGMLYVTSSESFAKQAYSIYTDMTEAGETEILLRVFKAPSKNYSGKYFITCTLA